MPTIGRTPPHNDALRLRVSRAADVLLDTADSLMDALRGPGHPTDSAVAPTVAQQWGEAVALRSELDVFQGDRPDKVAEKDYDRMFALETAALTGPINSRADAFAKLKVAHVWFERGGRADGADYRAVRMVADWLRPSDA